MLSGLCNIGCPVQLIREVFSRLHSLLSLTHICLALRRFPMFCLTLMRQLRWWFMCPQRSSFKRLLRSAILSLYIFHLLKVCWLFVKHTYLRVCWRSTIDLCLMNLPKHSSFKSVLKVFTLSKILLWIKPSYFSLENACYSWCMHQTGLFSSASVVPQCKFTD